jgi:hypothetical protein
MGEWVQDVLSGFLIAGALLVVSAFLIRRRMRVRD